jgi:hypothetical protein
VLNFFSSSFFLIFPIIVVPTIAVSMGVFVLVFGLVLFHSFERLICLCSFLFYLKNMQECLVTYDPSLIRHGAKTWGSMDN